MTHEQVLIFLMLTAVSIAMAFAYGCFRALQSLKTVRELKNLLPDALVLCNFQGDIIEMNAQARTLLGFNVTKNAKLKLTDFVVDDQDLLGKMIQHLKNHSLIDNVSAQIRSVLGAQIPVQMSCYVLNNARGRQSTLVFILRDVRDRIEMESRLVLSEKMVALGMMSGGVAHEINNPLGVIDGHLRMLRRMIAEKGADDDRIILSMNSIESMCIRITNIVRGLRLYSRNASNDPFVKTNVKVLIDDCLGLCRERFRNGGVKLVVDEIALSLYIDCRATEISQVLVNLLNNAFDAVVKSSNPWIKVLVEGDASQIRISIMDSGAGVPKAVRDKIFQPFFTTKAVGQGTGLGLSLSEGIVANHRGRLTIDDACPNTCFVIHLPGTQEVKDWAA